MSVRVSIDVSSSLGVVHRMDDVHVGSQKA